MPSSPRPARPTGARRQDPETGWVQHDWGTAPAEDHRRAEDLAEEVWVGRRQEHLSSPIAASRIFFEAGDDAGIAVPALVSVALDAFTDPGTLRQDQANVEAVAVDVFGEPDPPARLADYSHAGPVPAWVYDDLPSPLGALCRFYEEGPSRDTFLVGALAAVAGAMPFVRFRYDKKWSGVNLFLCVVAPSGAGKAPLGQAGRLLRPIDDHLLDVSEREVNDWEKAQKRIAKGEDVEGVPFERPPYRQLTYGGDSSDAAFFLGCYANGGHGAIFESEIATLLASMSKDWSDFRSKLLEGWANEQIKQNRKERRPLTIYHPEITLATSGTPRAFASWIRDNEDGLFNRSAFYTFDASPGWRSGWDEDERHEAMESAEGLLSGVLLRGYKELTTLRADPDDTRYGKRRLQLTAVFEADQQARLDEAFALQRATLPKLGLAPLQAYTHRSALTACRISAALSALRLAASGKSLSLPLKSFRVAEADFRVGLQVGALLMAHGVELARRHFRGVEGVPEETGPRLTPRRRFLDALGRAFGSEPFRRKDAIPGVIESVGLKSRKGDQFLKQLVEVGFLERIGESRGKGLYRRTDTAPPVGALVERAEGPPPVPVGYVAPHVLFPPGNDGQVGAEPDLPATDHGTPEPDVTPPF